MGATSPALETSTSIGPRRCSASAANAAIDSVSVRSRREREGLAAAGADRRGELLAALDAPGAEHDGVPGCGERSGGGRADAGGRAGDDGGAALGVGFEAGHQPASDATVAPGRGDSVVGIRANPRTLTECTRSRPAGSMS